MKYFSHLDKSQKNRVITNLRILKNKLSLENRKISVEVLKYQSPGISEIEIKSITNKLKYQKIFRDKKLKIYLPLNYKEIIL